MKKKGQSVKVKTAVINGRKKVVPSDYDGEFTIKSFLILRTPKHYDPSYMLLIDDDMVGWNVSDFHIIHMDVDEKYKGKRFYDVSESHFC